MKNTKKIIAVTGSNGFVGSYLVRYLEKKGYEVRKIQRKKIKNNKNVYYINDIYTHKNWEQILKNIYCVVHCAGHAHITNYSYSKNDLSKFNNTNHIGTKNIVEAAVKNKVKRFILLSSGLSSDTINNTGNFHLSRQNLSSKIKVLDNNIKSIKDKNVDPYRVSKMLGEISLWRAVIDSKIEGVVIRPPLVYGPGVKANFLSLIKLIDTGLPLPFLNFKNIRSFVSIYNLVDFIFECVFSSKAKNETFYVTDNISLDFVTLIKRIRHELNKKNIIFYLPKFIINLVFIILSKKNEFRKISSNFDINIDYTSKTMDWYPKFSFEETLKKTVLFYKKQKIK
jgi:nucleoside-diphosphate-sugar epimerase